MRKVTPCKWNVFLLAIAIIKLAHVNTVELRFQSSINSKHISGEVFPFHHSSFHLFPSIITRKIETTMKTISFKHEAERRRSNCLLQATFELILIIEWMSSLKCYRRCSHLLSLSHYISNEKNCYQWHDIRKALEKLLTTDFHREFSFFHFYFDFNFFCEVNWPSFCNLSFSSFYLIFWV